MDGSGLENHLGHLGISRALAALGFGANLGGLRAEIVVLDWRFAEQCSAESLAFFSVVLDRLCSMGYKVHVCSPQAADIRAAVREVCPSPQAGFSWVEDTSIEPKRKRCSCLSQVARFSGDGANASVANFIDALGAELSNRSLPAQRRRLVVGATIEVIQNILSHAHATFACACALILNTKRPKILQLGFADDGRGISASLIANPRYEWLASYHDVGASEHMLREKVSGRESSSASRVNKGGMGLLVERLLVDAKANLILRSGAALVSLRAAAPTQYQKYALNYGGGTQWRFEVRL